jgi:hypothetical protein
MSAVTIRRLLEAALVPALLDECALRVRVGDRNDLAVGVVLGHPQGQRTPAAAKLEDALAVREAGAGAGEFQHARFRGVEIADIRIPLAAGILEMLPEALVEIRRRHFVVLFVGDLGGQRDRGGAHGFDERLAPLPLRFDIAGRFPQALSQQLPDAEPEQRVGNAPAFGRINECVHLYPLYGLSIDRTKADRFLAAAAVPVPPSGSSCGSMEFRFVFTVAATFSLRR